MDKKLSDRPLQDINVCCMSHNIYNAKFFNHLFFANQKNKNVIVK